MPKVFICYRREDSAYPARHIYEVLSDYFGSESVVFDVDTIPLGTGFREYHMEEVSKCDILLAVIGDQWIEILKQRLDEPNDFVRIEIQAALEREIPVVPVLVGKATVPSEKNLPPELVGLAYKQAVMVHAEPDFQTDLKLLIGGLDRLFAELKADEEKNSNGQKDLKRNIGVEERILIEAKKKSRKNEAEMGNIFISYSHKDQTYVQKLADYLENEGLSVWVDERINHGDRWWQTIVTSIRKCAAMVVVMTPEGEKNDWVEKEYFFANDIKKPLFPLLLKGDCFPFFVNQHYHDVRDRSMPPKNFIESLMRLARQKIAADLKEKKTEEKRKRGEAEETKRKAKEERKPNAVEVTRREGKKRNQKEEKEHKPVSKRYTNSIGMKFVLIPAGNFMMGSKLRPEEVTQKFGGNAEWSKCEHPKHKVTISKPFYLQSTAVSQGQWKRIIGNNPSQFKGCGDDCPVEKVSWEDAQEFIRRLNKKEETYKYRLPTEAEWEYACRTGTMTEFFFGNDTGDLSEYAWHEGNSKGKTNPVGHKKANTWGLYDMHGNVYEWVEDEWHDNYEGAPRDGRAWVDKPKGLRRVFRGGCWSYGARHCRSANRNGDRPDYRSGLVGFRLSMSVALGS